MIKRVTWLNMPQLTLENIRVIFPNFHICTCWKKYIYIWRIINTIASTRSENTQIFLIGHYPLLQDQSNSLGTMFNSQTYNVRRQKYISIFSRQMEAIVYIMAWKLGRLYNKGFIKQEYHLKDIMLFCLFVFVAFFYTTHRQKPPFGANLSADIICSEKRTVSRELEENCALRGTDNVQR